MKSTESIFYDTANTDDIDELIRLRIAYMIDDFGSITDHERECMEKHLPDSWAKVHVAQKKFNESEFWHDKSALQGIPAG